MYVCMYDRNIMFLHCKRSKIILEQREREEYLF